MLLLRFLLRFREILRRQLIGLFLATAMRVPNLTTWAITRLGDAAQHCRTLRNVAKLPRAVPARAQLAAFGTPTLASRGTWSRARILIAVSLTLALALNIDLDQATQYGELLVNGSAVVFSGAALVWSSHTLGFIGFVLGFASFLLIARNRRKDAKESGKSAKLAGVVERDPIARNELNRKRNDRSNNTYFVFLARFLAKLDIDQPAHLLRRSKVMSFGSVFQHCRPPVQLSV
ncbi:MAG: hypothetical protein OXU77_07590 [Gammaproteobacteria bacterium]|nr:hypothetical protein [Gammaproteobacteria bacterium]